MVAMERGVISLDLRELSSAICLFTICFTICLFTSPDLDGNTGRPPRKAFISPDDMFVFTICLFTICFTICLLVDMTADPEY